MLTYLHGNVCSGLNRGIVHGELFLKHFIFPFLVGGAVHSEGNAKYYLSLWKIH
jgi:hypothetical protein